MSICRIASSRGLGACVGLTLRAEPRAEAGGVSPVREMHRLPRTRAYAGLPECRGSSHGFGVGRSDVQADLRIEVFGQIVVAVNRADAAVIARISVVADVSVVPVHAEVDRLVG